MNSTSNKPTMVFWIVGILALLWNLAGVSQFFTQAMNSESWRANFSPEMLTIIDALPLWYIVVFALAVFSSTLASIFLLARKKLAVPLFLVGFVAVSIQCVYNLFFNEARVYYEIGSQLMIILLPIFSAILYWFARKSEAKNLLT